MSHPVRVRLVQELAAGEACVCHLTQRLGLRQAAVSQQLSVLRRAGVVRSRRAGPYVLYRLADRTAVELLRAAGLEPAAPQPAPGCSCPRCRPAAEARTGWHDSLFIGGSRKEGG